MPLRDGANFAGFAIVRLLGSGVMGEVYLVQHPRLPRLQALRILPAALSADPDFRARFRREADLAASLTHPNIVGVHDRGEAQGQLWVLMGYVEGINAAQLLRDHYPHGLPRAEALPIIGAVADALDYAHERGLVHRAVRPGNILLANAGTAHRRILLADLGIARRVADIGSMSGTNLSYAAPEQLLDKSFEGRADQYSLAATAYHLLSGAPPFAHPSPAVIIGQHLNSPPPRLADTRPQLADMDGPLSRALAKDPGARFKRCQDFAAALGADTPTRQERTPTLTPSAPFPGPPPPQPPAPYPRPWTPPPGWGPPPRRAGRVWALGAVAVFVVAATIAAVAIGITHSMRPAAPSASPTSSVPAGPPVASSADTGPVGIVTDDPTCTAWMPISQIWLATALIERWDLIHPGQPNPLMVAGNAWTPDQRSVMQATGNATRLAATKTVPLARMTPHRVVRELYEQFVIYGRAFADSIANNYQPMQNALGATTESVLNALISVCHTVNSGAAARRATLADAIDAPAHPAPPQDLTDPKRFVVTSDLTLCGEVTSVSRKYTENPTVKDWVAGDHHLPASAWSPQQKGLSDAVAPLMLNVADDIWRTVQRGSNPVIQDFGALGAQYQRAFAKALPTYTVDDEEINGVAVYARYVLRDACAAVGS